MRNAFSAERDAQAKIRQAGPGGDLRADRTGAPGVSEHPAVLTPAPVRAAGAAGALGLRP